MYSSSEAAYSEYQEQGKGMTETLPPSYDVVVGAVPPAGSGTPSAPPLSQIPASETPLMSAHQGQTGYDGRGHTQQQSRRTSQADSAKPGCSKRGVEGYVKFSLAHTLRMNLEPDPTRQVYYTSNSLPTFVQHNNMELCARFIKYKFVLKSDGCGRWIRYPCSIVSIFCFC
jgi:hypothetical protein